ncbi:MAG: polysaccharide export protein [Gammaproteobacteria bacterium]|nr:polysaccharide export protein [Gammaproteobacteria bacterium]
MPANDTADNVTQPYRLGPEDVLSISVWREDGLEKETMIRPDGMLNFPLVGAIRAVGRTVEEVHDELVARLRRYIPDPVVSVSLLRIGSNRVFVIGEINKPGALVAGQYLDVMQALSLAGGFTAFADRDDIRILRRVDGQETVIDFDYDDVSKGKHLEQNILLKNGDVVVVP